MYWLTLFGTTTLPQYDAVFNAGTAPAPLAVAQLLGGGVFDVHGIGRSPQRYPAMLSYACSVLEATDSEAQITVKSLKSLIGVRAKLWRTRLGATTSEWCWARLTDVDDTMRSDRHQRQVPLVLSFALLGRWNGVYHNGGLLFGDSGLYFNDGLFFGPADDLYDLDAGDEIEQIIVVTNNGTMPVRDCIIRVTAGSAAITALKIGVAGVSELNFSQSVAAGDLLVLNCALKQVTNDGNAAWQYLTYTANHKIADWLVLESGANSISITKTGGGTGSTVEFQFYDGWS